MVFKNIKCLGEVSNNLLNDLSGTNVCKTLELLLQSLSTMLQWTNITSVIFLNKECFHHFIYLSFFQCCQVISLFQELKLQDDILF